MCKRSHPTSSLTLVFLVTPTNISQTEPMEVRPVERFTVQGDHTAITYGRPRWDHHQVGETIENMTGKKRPPIRHEARESNAADNTNTPNMQKRTLPATAEAHVERDSGTAGISVSRRQWDGLGRGLANAITKGLYNQAIKSSGQALANVVTEAENKDEDDAVDGGEEKKEPQFWDKKFWVGSESDSVSDFGSDSD